MKWFKHMSDSSEGRSLQFIMEKTGLEGYAIYFILMEMCASKIEPIYGRDLVETDFKFTFSSRIVRSRLRINSTKTDYILSIYQQLGLLLFKKSEKEYTFEVPKLLEYMDRDSKKTRQNRGKTAARPRLDKDKDKDKDKDVDVDKELRPATTTGITKSRDMENFEVQFHPESPKIREALVALGLKSLSVDIPKIIKLWDTADDFMIFIDTVKISKYYKTCSLDAEKRRYIAGAVRNELTRGENESVR